MRSPRGALASLTTLRYGGRRYECACCGGRFRALAPFHGRADARCPRCGSLERHRALALHLARNPDLLEGSAAILHFAPHPAETRVLPRDRDDYVSADLEPGAAMQVVDICEMPYDDRSFDLAICSHVLEHVSDDHAAMTELWRVLRPGGTALLQSPVDLRRASTYEDDAIVSPEGRRRAFWQEDHVRLYGRDFAERLRATGFEVRVYRYTRLFTPQEVERYRLDVRGDPTGSGGDVYEARRPAATSGERP